MSESAIYVKLGQTLLVIEEPVFEATNTEPASNTLFGTAGQH